MFESVSVLELKKLFDINLIDIRSVEKYNDNHILNSINIPFDKLIVNPNKYLDKTKKYYIYCQKGVQSISVCQTLKNKGYNVVNLIGGYEEWILNE